MEKYITDGINLSLCKKNVYHVRYFTTNNNAKYAKLQEYNVEEQTFNLSSLKLLIFFICISNPMFWSTILDYS